MGNLLPPPTVLTALGITTVGGLPEDAVRVIPPSDSIIDVTTYTFDSDDTGLWKRCISDAPVTLTIPQQALVPLPLYTTIFVQQWGLGPVMVVPGSGVVMHSPGGVSTASAQYAVLRLFQNEIDVWTLIEEGGGGGGGVAAPFSVNVSFLPKAKNAETLLLYVFPEVVTFPANFSLNQGFPGLNATATMTIKLYRNPTFTGDTITGGTEVGTITYSTLGVFTFASTGGTSVVFAPGEAIGVKAQDIADATASGCITLRGARG